MRRTTESGKIRGRKDKECGQMGVKRMQGTYARETDPSTSTGRSDLLHGSVCVGPGGSANARAASHYHSQACPATDFTTNWTGCGLSKAGLPCYNQPQWKKSLSRVQNKTARARLPTVSSLLRQSVRRIPNPGLSQRRHRARQISSHKFGRGEERTMRVSGGVCQLQLEQKGKEVQGRGQPLRDP